MDTATDLLKRLSPDQIRRRLEEIAAEEKALRILLRAASRLTPRNSPSARRHRQPMAEGVAQ